MQMALRVFPGLLYGAGHAYGNPLTGSGTTDSVTKMKREELVKFHQTWYRPNNATLVVVGDTTLGEIKPKLEKLFASWKTGQIPKKNVGTVSLASKSTVYLMDKPGALQSVLIAGIVAPGRGSKDEIPIQTMNTILGGMFMSRLNMNLREDKHWSYGARSRLNNERKTNSPVHARIDRLFLAGPRAFYRVVALPGSVAGIRSGVASSCGK